MISLNITMKQEEAKAAVLGLDPQIKFIDKRGISLLFETPDDAAFAVTVKAALKADIRFKALFFTVDVKK